MIVMCIHKIQNVKLLNQLKLKKWWFHLKKKNFLALLVLNKNEEKGNIFPLFNTLEQNSFLSLWNY